MKIVKMLKLFSTLLFFFLIGCTTNNKLEHSLPCIDVRKKYPEKEIVLTDIADIKYVHLSTENDEYLYKGRICDVTENTIVVGDNSSGSILFFSRDGKPKFRFNRKGGGPEEYSQFLNSMVIYDETADDVYVCIDWSKQILVYSHTGKFKRKLPLSNSVSSLVNFDEYSLFVHDDQFIHRRQGNENYTSSQALDSSFIRISKEDGKVLDYALIPYSDVDLSKRHVDGESSIVGINTFIRMVKCMSGVYLCNPESDTIFLYGKDKTIIPVICKTPLVNNLDPKVVLTGFVDAGRYLFMHDFTIVNRWGDKPPKSNCYGYDKQTGELFSPKISLPDYKGEYYNSISSCFSMDLYRLKQAYNENRLGGNLKELVATLDEDKDNSVYVFATFK